MKSKYCTKCGETKLLSKFHKDSNRKEGVFCHCKECKKKYYKASICNFIYSSIKMRCNSTKSDSYKDYGGRGIKCLITAEELKELWFRDKAYLMKQPSIDRKDNDGHYEYNNCHFMEMYENNSKAHCRPVLQYDLKGNFIKEWKSLTDANTILNINKSNICSCCNGKYRQSGGYIWRYKND